MCCFCIANAYIHNGQITNPTELSFWAVFIINPTEEEGKKRISFHLRELRKIFDALGFDRACSSVLLIKVLSLWL